MNLTESDFDRLRARLARLPEKDRLDAPAIARRLARLGLSCDDDTVRTVMSYERGELVEFAETAPAPKPAKRKGSR